MDFQHFTTPEFLGFLTGISLFVSVIVTAFGKYAMPLIYQWFVGKKDDVSATIDKVYKFETNHIPHLEQAIDDIKEEQIKQGNRLTRVETLLESKLK